MIVFVKYITGGNKIHVNPPPPQYVDPVYTKGGRHLWQRRIKKNLYGVQSKSYYSMSI